MFGWGGDFVVVVVGGGGVLFPLLVGDGGGSAGRGLLALGGLGGESDGGCYRVGVLGLEGDFEEVGPAAAMGELRGRGGGDGLCFVRIDATKIMSMSSAPLPSDMSMSLSSQWSQTGRFRP